MKNLAASLRIGATSLLVCCLGYSLLVLAFARIVTPSTAEGSLLHAPDGRVVGSRLIAQSFTGDRYFWPRPSAVNYDASAAGGSNLSPANPAVAERARGLIARYGASSAAPLPADLVTASGSGLDPHISLEAAEYQAPRIARNRGLRESDVRELAGLLAVPAGEPLAPESIVNVLELNLALDKLGSRP
ncbi:MAG: potassium-transporting ATPase subunit C [Chthoniobacterales bacterium]|nr:potassium-transporting ATPase subunit C [Chthoniobacterales bacterium]